MWKMSPHMYNLCCFVVKLILSRFTHFCRKICFVAIYALLCGEKLNQKLPLWRKNDKYEVWPSLTCAQKSKDNMLFTKSVLSRFTRFCVEKNLAQNCICGEKMTNMRYVREKRFEISQVCSTKSKKF